jgi:hypothetical protein
MYESEITQFLRNLKQEKPGLEARQRQGRQLLWDQEVDRAFQAQTRASNAPQKAYVYATDNDWVKQPEQP